MRHRVVKLLVPDEPPSSSEVYPHHSNLLQLDGDLRVRLVCLRSAALVATLANW